MGPGVGEPTNTQLPEEGSAGKHKAGAGLAVSTAAGEAEGV